MLLTQVTGPAVTPVSVAEVKAAARVDHDDDDVEIANMIDEASRAIGQMAGRVLVPETWAVSFAFGEFSDLRLPLSPVTALTSITYFDADDAEQTADTADFYLIADDDRAMVRPKRGASWPKANSLRDDAIKVTFQAGYASCPATLRRAVLLMATHLYDHRSVVSKDQVHEVPLGIRFMVDSERLGWFGA